MKYRTKIPLIAILLIVHVMLNCKQNFAQCDIDDWFALKDLYNDANGNNWNNQTNWTMVSANSFPPANCNLANLYGVSLTNGRVSELILSNNNLSGSIAPEIDNLTALSKLWLYNNNLTGSLPPNMGNLSNLTDLRINDNSFVGDIPASFGDLNLSQMRLQNNNLSGCYDENLLNLCNTLSSTYNSNTYISNGNNFDASWGDFCNSSQGCCNCLTDMGCNPDDWFALRKLYFDTNGANWTDNTGWNIVTGSSVPNQCDLSTLYGITTNDNGRVSEIDLFNNNLVGTIPSELDKLSELEGLIFRRNELTAYIPSELGNINNLRWLSLGDNQLTGGIPVELGGLTNLEALYLYTNQLTGNIPSELGNLNELVYLNLTSNQLTGSIPSELGNLNINLFTLDLSNNQLIGNIPVELENLSRLNSLNFKHNLLSGVIPSQLSNLSNLTYLYLDNNQLTGNIPKELADLSYLQYLYLDNNQLNGNIPKELSNLSNLRSLYLNINQLTGSIPKELGDLSNLTTLYLNDNQFTGNIPTELGDLSNLTNLRINNNDFSSNIPSGLSNLINLKELLAYNNQLSNNIPNSIGNLSSLEILDLNNNCLAGNIPAEIGNLTSLETLFLDNNQFSGKLPKELGNLSNLTKLTLHHNQFTYCYEPDLSNLCNQLESSYNNNASISATNFFDDSWQSFCNNQSGECAACNNCTVWPDDFNYDGIVNNQDLAVSHLYLGESGIARSTPGTSWQAYNCPDWGTPQPNGNDIKHHDGDGNGNINTNDKNAIVLNYGKTHPLPPGISAGITPEFTNTDYQIYLQPVNLVNNNANTVIMNVVLERKSGADIELLGGHFTIDYSQFGANISNAAMNFKANSWLGNLNINLYEKSWHEPNNNVIHVGFTKTNGNNSIGKGVIGAVTFQLNTANLNRQDPCSTLFDVEINKICSYNDNTDLLPTENEYRTVNLGTPCCEPFININEHTAFQNLFKSSGTITTDSLVIIGQNQQVEYRAKALVPELVLILR